jgi:LasA protease
MSHVYSLKGNGTTSLWNKLTDGTWVTDAYMWTGLGGPINGWC